MRLRSRALFAMPVRGMDANRYSGPRRALRHESASARRTYRGGLRPPLTHSSPYAGNSSSSNSRSFRITRNFACRTALAVSPQSVAISAAECPSTARR